MSTRRRYILAGGGEDDYGEYSADSGDYWNLRGDYDFGLALVKLDHPYKTVTGRVVYGPRVLKASAKVRDLWRLGI